jgi:PKD domain-containing protein
MDLVRLCKVVVVMAVTLVASVFVASCGDEGGGGNGGNLKITGNADQFAGPTPLVSRFSADAKNAKGDVAYRWRFDDGTTSKEQNPTHRFLTAGYYTVILDARDEAGYNDRQTFLLGAWTPGEWGKARETPLTAARAKRAQRIQQRRTDARLRALRKQYQKRAREQTQG